VPPLFFSSEQPEETAAEAVDSGQDPSRPQNAGCFRQQLILQAGGAYMMQHGETDNGIKVGVR
jgi:hypothetical protein